MKSDPWRVRVKWRICSGKMEDLPGPKDLHRAGHHLGSFPTSLLVLAKTAQKTRVSVLPE